MKKLALPVFLSLIAASCANIPKAEAYNPEGYKKFISYAKAMARQRNISDATISEAFENNKFNYKVIALDRKQPERSKGPGFQRYKARVVTQENIDRARAKFYQNRQALNDIQAKYGVDEDILVALWGIESRYGEVMGNFNVINSLTSLAYEGRRRQFFLDELLNALAIMDQRQTDLKHFSGSWAGAFGQFQFMPSTYLKYAVDHDGDGRKDLWNDNGDALASAANYLSRMGWQPGIGWGKRVILPHGFDMRFVNKNFSQPMYRWKQLGLINADGTPLSNSVYNGTLLDPDGDSGDRSEVYLVTDNFKRIMEWNRSTYFATSVGLIADAIKK